MKIGLVKTYHCDICERRAYPIDIETTWPDEQPQFWSSKEPRIFIVYQCSCGMRTQRVEHVIDENGELFPHYTFSVGGSS